MLDAAQHTKIETIFPVLNGYLMWIINQENKLTNIYYKLFYMTNIRKTRDFFKRLNIFVWFTWRGYDDRIMEIGRK